MGPLSYWFASSLFACLEHGAANAIGGSVDIDGIEYAKARRSNKRRRNIFDNRSERVELILIEFKCQGFSFFVVL